MCLILFIKSLGAKLIYGIRSQDSGYILEVSNQKNCEDGFWSVAGFLFTDLCDGCLFVFTW